MSDPREGVSPTPCPRCSYYLNAATHYQTIDGAAMEHVPDARPRAGDATVCVGCGTVLVFDQAEGGLTLHQLTKEEEGLLEPQARELIFELRDQVVAGLRAKTERN